MDIGSAAAAALAEASLAPATADPLPAMLAAAWLPLRRLGVTRPPGGGDPSELFRAAHAIRPRLSGAGATEQVALIETHLDYLANKALVPVDQVINGAPLAVDRQVLLDAVVNVGAALESGRAMTAQAHIGEGLEVPPSVLAVIEEAERTLEGWCSRETALAIARAVLAIRPETCVEIGVYGGRSAMPCAATLRHLGAGSLACIESWSAAVATAHSVDEENDRWWAAVDFPRIKRDFLGFVVRHELTAQTRIVEAPSARAAALFDRIDYLHVDGAHSVVNAAEDVILYAQKVRPGGIVLFDDVDWETTRPAMGILAALCDVEEMLFDPATGHEACALMRRR
jgi:predicted O-methyltransferase YrrM